LSARGVGDRIGTLAPSLWINASRTAAAPDVIPRSRYMSLFLWFTAPSA